MKNKFILIIGVSIIIAITVTGFVINKTKKTSDTLQKQTLAHKTYQAPLSNDVIKSKSNSSEGTYLTEPNGQALYVYDRDSKAVSNCLRSCITNWPPYLDTGSTTDLPANISTIKRNDTSVTQFTYKGLPLYTFRSDTNGRATGNGVAGFKIAKP